MITKANITSMATASISHLRAVTTRWLVKTSAAIATVQGLVQKRGAATVVAELIAAAPTSRVK